jgi:biotin operon repressor
MGTQTNTAQVIEFKLPKRPKIIEKQAPPDQRSLAVVPLRAIRDRNISDSQLRTLATICSYCNRAGLTWVGQDRVGKDLGVSKQSINKQVKRLVELGYLEVVSKGFRGERANTTRVIYDTEIKAEDAIAITSGQEDTRPPETRRREAKEMTQQGEDVTRSVTNAPKTVTNSSDLPGREPEFTEEQMAANRKRLREMLSGMAPKNHTTHGLQSIGDVMGTTRKLKAKKPSHSQPNTVDNDKGLHSQLHSQPNGVDRTQKNIGYEEVLSIYEDISKHRFSNVRTTRIDEVDLRCAAIMCEVGVGRQKFIDACQTMPVCLRLSEVCEQLAGEATGF